MLTIPILAHRLIGLPYFKNSRLVFIPRTSGEHTVIAVTNWTGSGSGDLDFKGVVLTSSLTDLGLNRGSWVEISLSRQNLLVKKVRPTPSQYYRGTMSKLIHSH